MKTLEDLGFEIDHEFDGGGDERNQYVVYINREPDTMLGNIYTNTYTLFSDGEVFGNDNNGMTKEIYEAIGYEMKKRGWWK